MNDNVQLAGAIKNIGDTWATILDGWVSAFLMIALVLVCLVQVVRKMSIKAGLGAIIGLVLCWSLFTGRIQLSNLFNTEFKDPAGAAPAMVVNGPEGVPAVFQGQL
ncbi:hypothetical protein ACFC26_22070 [Kitasatospora purpeofusca]|uniref:hypothetical protein n=1 Tax=Kitasatospora purpeofusca TaxID=67352 RepID=UPI0035E2E107